jgi:hypothetical protein|tara:strand:- start:3512 stop:5065 length:1554 start_codon:yes stop_codon:yes gene_type:complete
MSDIEFLNKLSNPYENLNYYDNYTTYLILFAFVTIVTAFAVSYMYVMMFSKQIKDNWVAQRCNPLIMPFAGQINAPSTTSSAQYTTDNFNYCSQQVVTDALSTATLPVTYTNKVLHEFVSVLQESINSIREMINKLRNSLKDISAEVMGRIGNIMIPIQQVTLKIRDFLGKIQGTLVAVLYTSLGSYYTLQSLMGAIVEFITIILIALSICISIMWLIPLTWGAASAMTVVFLSVAIPMTLILVVMVEVLHVSSGLKIPKVKCFDEETTVTLLNRRNKAIKDIKIGDKLSDRSLVTAVIKVLREGSEMYELDGVIVSDSHVVKTQDTWIRVDEHPLSKRVVAYDKKHLYCINTTSKVVKINSTTFTDWDEVYDELLAEICDFQLNGEKINELQNIHEKLDGGFYASTQIRMQNGEIIRIKDVQPNDLLFDNISVYGVVKIDALSIEHHYVHNTEHSCIHAAGRIKCYNKKNFKPSNSFCLKLKERYLYHLLTDKGHFYLNEVCVADYNSAIDFYNGS